MTSPTLNLAPQARQQLAAVAGLRWRVFINSLRTFRGRLELASRIFISLAFLGGGIGGAVGLGGAAWFLILHGNVEWLGTLLWPVFLFWQLFPLMATAFTQNVESSNLLRFPLSYRSYFLIRLAYGSLDPATAVASLWLLGIDIGIGIARPRALPWATIVLLTFALVNIVLARMLFAWLERWLAQRRTREILGILFFLFILSFQLIGPLIAAYEHRSIPHSRVLGQKLTNAQRPLPPGLAAAAIAGMIQGQPGTSVVPSVLLVSYGIAFLWLLNFRLRAEYRGESFSESARRKVAPSGLPAPRLGWNLPGSPARSWPYFEKELRYLSRSGPMLFTLIVPLFMLAVFRSSGKNEGLLARMPGTHLPPGRRLLAVVADQSFLQQFWSGWQRHPVFLRFAGPLPANRDGQEPGACRRVCAGSWIGVAGNLFALPAAIAGRDHGHTGGHSVCRAHRPGRRQPVFDLFPHPD